MKTICRLMMLALLVAPPLARAVDRMLSPGVLTGAERVIPAEAPPAPRPSGGYVCAIEMVGAVPERPFGGVQFSLTPGKDCAGEEETFVVWIASDDVAARSTGSDPAYSEAHVMAMQQGLLTAAREGWRVFVEHDPGRAVVEKLTIRMN